MAVISTTIKRIAYTHGGGGVLYIRTYIAHENGFINIYELLLRV